MSHNVNKVPSTTDEPKYRNVLITRFRLLGDVAMSIPVVYSACEAHRDVRFVIATQSVASTLFVNAPANLTVVSVDHKTELSSFGAIRRLARRLVDEYGIDAVVDLQGEYQSWLLCLCLRMCGVKKVVRIDKGKKGKRALTRRRNKRMFPLVTQRDRYREALNRMGFSFDETFASIYGESAKGDPAEFAHIAPAKQSGERWIAVAPFDKWNGKIYPMHLMEKVLDQLSAVPGVRLFFLGQGDNERDRFREWTAKYANATSLAERRYGFPVELALLSHCDVMLSMDNMNMHLASLVRVPVVSVWGASHPYCGFMGWKQDEKNVVQLNMACRPCSLFGDKKCYYNDFFCLTGIQPQMVVSAVLRVLDVQP